MSSAISQRTRVSPRLQDLLALESFSRYRKFRRGSSIFSARCERHLAGHGDEPYDGLRHEADHGHRQPKLADHLRRVAQLHLPGRAGSRSRWWWRRRRRRWWGQWWGGGSDASPVAEVVAAANLGQGGSHSITSQADTAGSGPTRGPDAPGSRAGCGGICRPNSAQHLVRPV